MPKNHPRIESYGTIDELNSHIGVVRAVWPASPIDDELQRIQSDLFAIGSRLAADDPVRYPGVAPERTSGLEAAIDSMEQRLTPLANFILPGGSLAAAHLHVARTVCRRAERLVVALPDAKDQETIGYLNRLSDYLFVAARLANVTQGVPDCLWRG